MATRKQISEKFLKLATGAAAGAPSDPLHHLALRKATGEVWSLVRERLGGGAQVGRLDALIAEICRSAVPPSASSDAQAHDRQ